MGRVIGDTPIFWTRRIAENSIARIELEIFLPFLFRIVQKIWNQSLQLVENILRRFQ